MREIFDEGSSGVIAQRNALLQQTRKDRSGRSKRLQRLRLLAIVPLAIAVLLVFLGLLVYQNVLLTVLGTVLVVAVVIPIFLLERKEEGLDRVPLHLDRGDYLALGVGLPTLILLGVGMETNDTPLLGAAFVLLVAFFALMYWNNRKVPEPSPVASS